MTLVSDRKLVIDHRGYAYWDYYDHHFELKHIHPTAPRWNRNCRTDFPSRRLGFSLMQQHGIPCVPNGLVKYVASRLTREEHYNTQSIDRLVVYTDETMHQGLGKELLSPEQAIKEHPDCWCSVYMQFRQTAISHRRLCIGKRCFIVEYSSQSDWRSNHQTSDIRVLEEVERTSAECDLMKLYQTPILAIDSIPSAIGNTWLATDFNLAPGMRGSGIEDVVPAIEAANLIKEMFFSFE
jgi:hypothetical protein